MTPCACLLICGYRKHSYVQLCAELQGSVPCPAPQAAASTDRLQIGRQGFLDLAPLYGSQWRLPAAPTAQSGPCSDLWRRHCWDISSLPPGQTGLDRYSAVGAGQVSEISVMSAAWKFQMWHLVWNVTCFSYKQLVCFVSSYIHSHKRIVICMLLC